jgi:hypothetical protein
METAWHAQQHRIRSRRPIHIRLLEGAVYADGHTVEHDYGLCTVSAGEGLNADDFVSFADDLGIL